MKGLEIYLILTLLAFVFIGVSYTVKKEVVKNLIFISSAIIATYCIGTFVGKLQRLNYNAWYSGSTEKLIKAVVGKLEEGQQERVIQELKRLDSKLNWTYEVKGHYDEYVREAVKSLNSNQTQSNPTTE